METTKLLKLGQVVIALAGRDRGKTFVITRILDDRFVEIVDGRRRTLKKPKKKNIKHLMVTNTVIEEITSKETGKYQFNDAYIRRVLENFENESGGPV